MNHSTPLQEVAHHLPAPAAEMLGTYPTNVQVATLTAIRATVTFWESVDVELEPVQYGYLLHSLVAMAAPAYLELLRLNAQVFSLETRLKVADNLIESMGGGTDGG